MGFEVTEDGLKMVDEPIWYFLQKSLISISGKVN